MFLLKREEAACFKFVSENFETKLGLNFFAEIFNFGENILGQADENLGA